MLTFFAIVAFLLFQIGLSVLCLRLTGTKRHREVLSKGIHSFF